MKREKKNDRDRTKKVENKKERRILGGEEFSGVYGGGEGKDHDCGQGRKETCTLRNHKERGEKTEEGERGEWWTKSGEKKGTGWGEEVWVRGEKKGKGENSRGRGTKKGKNNPRIWEEPKPIKRKK